MMTHSFITLMYHRVNDQLPSGELVVGIDSFRAQMRWLKETRRVIGMKELLDEKLSFAGQRKTNPGHGDSGRTGHRPGNPDVLVTLDDGYADNYWNAFPVLKDICLPATVFLTTSYVGTTFKKPRYSQVPWEKDYMSWQQAREMQEGGCFLAAHTATHPHLIRLDKVQQKSEIQMSFQAIEQHLGSERRVFCYPYGEYNQDTLSVLEELETVCAFTVEPGVNDESTSPLLLRRIGISGQDTMEEFINKVTVL